MGQAPISKSYRVLALVEGEPGAARAIAPRLLQVFGLPARPGFDTALSQRGVVVATSGDLDEAQDVARRVAQAGASFRIVDGTGAVVDRGGPDAGAGKRGTPGTRPPASPVGGRTLAGGYQARPPASARAATSDTVSANDLDVLFADAGLPSGTHPTLSAGALAAAAMDRTLEGIDQDALVLLDGTVAEEASSAAAAPGLERRELGGPQQRPGSENEAIELDLPYAAPEEEAELLDPLEPLSLGEGTQPGLGKPRRLGSARKAPPLTLLGGRLRDYPRVRISLGFTLALLLSSFAPLCHSGSVMQDRVASLRSDLATFRAQGQRLVRPADYRPPQQVEDEILSVKLRHGAFALLIWVAMSSGLLFLWFRFT
ncbi:MAG: hypothetical protein IPL40_08830 [Proteobacteria bacterium]|nr:hypothetical protein [Pseudomonadota bacterium]